MSHLRRLTREGHRQMIEEMATVLIGLPELDDFHCIMALLSERFRSADVFRHLDTARDMARQARSDEAGLWERLMR
jgi:hypothetical protein